ncbi:MAG: hypothetical protein CMD96_07015 [Gammaproteobacteria bacterium]|jgi:predicted nucleic acid-binding protein|nr:hypothetical protein [Gammaproteobacteria bacterium]
MVYKNFAKKAQFYKFAVQKGNKIPINDVWIAACCMEVDGILLTRDKHFELLDLIDLIIL